MTSPRIRSLRATIGGFAMVLLAAFMGAVPAAAVATVANPSQINPSAVGSITIHKYLVPDPVANLQPGNGTDHAPPAGATPLPGVVFTLSPIDGVDLTTTGGWDQAQAYLSGAAGLKAAASHRGTVITSTPTDRNGITAFRQLPLGLYLVHEVPADPSLIPAEDFLVTVPMADPSGASWLYDVHVHPKNSRVAITKSVADGNAGVAGQDAPVAGRVLTYSLDADIPATGLDAADGVYEIADDLTHQSVPGIAPPTSAANYLEFIADDWVGAVSVSVDGSELAACLALPSPSCDYLLTRSSSSIRVVLTAHGRSRLAAARAASTRAQVHVTIEARVRDTVNAVVAGSVLIIPNTATLIPSALAKANGTSVKSNEVKTLFGTLVLHKVSQATGASLSGAVFTLYRTRNDALEGRDPLAVSTATTADGITAFGGLHITDFQNDAIDDDDYWLIESVAPQGYVAASDPIRVRLLSDGSTAGADQTGGLLIANAREPRGTLSFTGVDIGWLLSLGIALILAGGVAIVVTRRRRDEDQGQP